MCVAAAPARFTGTILYHGLRNHPEHGRVHVLGYQNTAQNLASGPNAMLLHLPAKGMTQANFIDTSGCSRVLRDMLDAVRPFSYGRGPGAPAGAAPGGPPPVQVFDHDIYTVVLATDPTLIPDALRLVPEHKRIPVNRPLFDFYAALYPDYAVALCCFDNREAMAANPLLMWYEPHDPGRFALPAIDCHTGAVPDLAASVLTDHWVILGTDEAPPDWGAPVFYTQPRTAPVAAFLPDRVIGTAFNGWQPNGDFVISHDEVLRGEPGLLRRIAPGWAPPL
ncbi:hypothetical protein Acsp03_14920 [Actinomadura sp. NBRC 104412]|uniref:hypothetical protein n=1 Tax=Actinomadura sp. NBRC 104412 TaxID=3032203 RepID=UPI0024A0C985|nr:hypothetical protein [Actinomadura sp. NBRC 104412]GLZ04026.1 hypothetical protein Acsp03_14920 [Actinomadura sp. NBRC 104412]